jgi:hypothetical protein
MTAARLATCIAVVATVCVGCQTTPDEPEPGVLTLLANAPEQPLFSVFNSLTPAGVSPLEDGGVLLADRSSIVSVDDSGDVSPVIGSRDEFLPAGADPDVAPAGVAVTPSIHGMLPEPNGDLLIGNAGALLRLTADGDREIVLGSNASLRPLAADVPLEVAAPAGSSDFAFTERVAPLGRMPDGSLAMVDGPILWSWDGAVLHQLYRRQSVPEGTSVFALNSDGAVDSAGNVYVHESAADAAPMDQVVVVAPDGSTSHAPTTIEGLPGAAAAVRIIDLAGDGASVTALVRDDAGLTRLIRLSDDRWITDAASTDDQECVDLGDGVPLTDVPQALGSQVGIREGRRVFLDTFCARATEAVL